MNQTGIFKYFSITIILMAVSASFLLAQVWKQNKYIEIKKKKMGLHSRYSKLKSEVARIDLDIRELKNYNRLEKIGKKYGLDYHGVPELIFVKGNHEK